jgi:hypothetical protein
MAMLVHTTFMAPLAGLAELERDKLRTRCLFIEICVHFGLVCAEFFGYSSKWRSQSMST